MPEKSVWIVGGEGIWLGKRGGDDKPVVFHTEREGFGRLASKYYLAHLQNLVPVV